MTGLSSSLLSLVFITMFLNSQIPSTAANQLADTNRTSRVAVVTGSNRGIGFAIVKALCQQFDGIVYLTARTEAQGLAAVHELNQIDLHPRFHQLDVTDDSSIEAFKNFFNTTHGGLDILINNAGILSGSNSTAPLFIQASETLRVNYFGSLKVSNALFPLLRPHARVVQISSAMGHLSRIPGDQLKARLSSSDLTEEGLNQILQEFVEATKTDTREELGYPNDPYTVSKVGVSALVRIKQKEFDADPREDIVINGAQPGYVRTGLTGYFGDFDPDRGSQSAVYLALLPNNTDIKGKYVWHDKSIVDWVNDPLPNY